MKDLIVSTLNESRSMLDALITDDTKIEKITEAAQLILKSLQQNNTIFSCGNGGSMSDAMHFAEELSGRYRQSRKALSAIAISDPGHISCVANDFGYEFIFSRYLEAHGRPGDCLLGISTSGRSANVIKAAQLARESGINIISLTGKPGSELGALADIDICVGASGFADRIQELHIKVIHILIELVERNLFPENYQ